MFNMEKDFIEARLFWFRREIGNPGVPQDVGPGMPIPYVDSKVLADVVHDEKLLQREFVDHMNNEAESIFRRVRGELKSDWKGLSPELVAEYFR